MADWQTALETVAAAYARGTLEKDARTISEAYRLKTGEGRRLLTRQSEAAAYALSRMPATVEAAKAALTEALAATGLAPKTLLDCGAGTGAVTFAADALLGLERATCLERETAMRAVGQQLMREGLGMGEISGLAKETMAVAREHAGADVVDEVVASVPGLSQVV